jgi:hypothetical protein
MKVITKGRIHLDGSLLKQFRDELTRITPPHIEKYSHGAVMKRFLDHDNLCEGDMLEMEVVGSEEEHMVDGHVLLVFGPLSIEVDGRELRRALLPFIGK